MHLSITVRISELGYAQSRIVLVTHLMWKSYHKTYYMPMLYIPLQLDVVVQTGHM